MALQTQDDLPQIPGLSDEDQQKEETALLSQTPQAPTSSLGMQVGPWDQIPKTEMHEAGKMAYAQLMPKITADPGSTDYFRQRQEQLEFEKAHPWGAPISKHPGTFGTILHGIARGGQIAGDIIAPATMENIPGTDLNKRDQEAENLRGIEKGEQLENQGEEASAAETKANAEKETADTAAKAAGQPKPKEEEWDIVPNFQGPNGEPILKEKNSGQMRLADSVPGIRPTEKPDKTTQSEQLKQAIADAFEKGDQKTVKAKQAELKAIDPEGAERLNISLGNQADKRQEETEKKNKPFQDVLDQINEGKEFAAQPSPTNDFGLLMAFVGVTKPESVGKIRFNQQELRTVVGTRSALGDVQALEQKLANGEMLTPEQRKDMLATMEIVGRHAQDRLSGGGGGTQRFTVDGRTYNIPAEKVAEFKKDHPNAQ